MRGLMGVVFWGRDGGDVVSCGFYNSWGERGSG
jgi:hypothetical protein